MELNEITRQLPPHLLQFVVDQPYHQYTPVDQAVWRYVMRKNYTHLTKVAHPSYVDGLIKAGIDVESIPTLYGMNRILKKIGWAAVAVDGFIPPGAFMEFTAFKVLVIAADIRTLEHIEYTPAPDIIHESAGHAPIIAHPDFAEYLVEIGKVGAKAFSSKKDNELYEAIRHLSIIKEDPNTPLKDIEEGEYIIRNIAANMGKPSEMALLRNLHWWTVEYGLIGTTDNFKIYGAGLLSSIGESESCLKPEVKKIPYGIHAAHVNYDITRPQPQLFVTPDFHYLKKVLQEYAQTMAFTKGGLEGMIKAVESENTGTIILDGDLELSGTFVDFRTDAKGNLVWTKTNGPTAIAFHGKQLPSHGKWEHRNGIMVVMENIKNILGSESNLSIEYFLHPDHTIEKQVHWETTSGLKISGVIEKIYQRDQLIFLVTFKSASVVFKEEILYSGSFEVAFTEKIKSVYAGPADIEAFEVFTEVPQEKTHKIQYSSKTLKLHKLYQLVREIREQNKNDYLLPKIATMVQNYFPDDWLLSLEILELTKNRRGPVFLSEKILLHLNELKEKNPSLKKLIEDGIQII